jgi:hypothetical protein
MFKLLYIKYFFSIYFIKLIVRVNHNDIDFPFMSVLMSFCVTLSILLLNKDNVFIFNKPYARAIPPSFLS